MSDIAEDHTFTLNALLSNQDFSWRANKYLIGSRMYELTLNCHTGQWKIKPRRRKLIQQETESRE